MIAEPATTIRAIIIRRAVKIALGCGTGLPPPMIAGFAMLTLQTTTRAVRRIAQGFGMERRPRMIAAFVIPTRGTTIQPAFRIAITNGAARPTPIIALNVWGEAPVRALVVPIVGASGAEVLIPTIAPNALVEIVARWRAVMIAMEMLAVQP